MPHTAEVPRRAKSAAIRQALYGKGRSGCKQFLCPRNAQLLLVADHANASMLGQVINSLITNAIEAMSPRGKLAITSRLAEHRQVEVCVIDTGAGIKAADIAAVVKPFHTTKAKGLGLGLPLAKRIVERYGGTLAITSCESGVASRRSACSNAARMPVIVSSFSAPCSSSSSR